MNYRRSLFGFLNVDIHLSCYIEYNHLCTAR